MTQPVATIGFIGADYTTWDEWILGEAGDLVQQGISHRCQIQSDFPSGLLTQGVIIGSSWTTGPNNRLYIEAAPGQSHGGQRRSGAYLVATTDSGTLPMIRLSAPHVEVLDLDFWTNNAARSAIQFFDSQTDQRVRRCLFQQTATSATNRAHVVANVVGTNCGIESCWFDFDINLAGGTNCIEFNPAISDFEIVQCMYTNRSGGGRLLGSTGASTTNATIQNNLWWVTACAAEQITSGANITNNAFRSGYGQTPIGANQILNVADITDITDAANGNYEPVVGGKLDNTGAPVVALLDLLQQPWNGDDVGTQTTAGGPSDPVQDVIDRMSALTPTEEAAIRTFVGGLVTDGIWDGIDEFFHFGLNPTDWLTGFRSHTATVTGGITNSINGATTVQGSEHLDTTVDLTTLSRYALTDGEIGVYTYEMDPWGTLSTDLFGAEDESFSTRIRHRGDVDNDENTGMNTAVGTFFNPVLNASDIAGKLHSLKSTPTAQERYVDANKLPQEGAAPAGIPTPTVWVFRLNRVPSASPLQAFPSTHSSWYAGARIDTAQFLTRLRQFYVDLGIAPAYSITGDVTTTFTPAATLLYTPAAYAITGDVTTTFTPSAALQYTPGSIAITGSVVTTFTPAAALQFTAPEFSITGNVTTTFTPAADLQFSQRQVIIGSVVTTFTPEAALLFTQRGVIEGNVLTQFIPQAVLQFRTPLIGRPRMFNAGAAPTIFSVKE